MRNVFALVILTGLLAVGLPASGAKWVRLFNGRNLNGWQKNGTEKWEVQEGAILGESTTGHYGYLTTTRTYKNFNLRLQFKGLAGGNSGVFIRSRITGINPKHGPDIVGMQVEVDPNLGRHTGGLYESGGRGWVMKPTPEGEKALRPGEWNNLEIIADGSHIVTRLNGVTAVDFTDASPHFTEGVVGLQLHTGGGVKMLFRHIELQAR